MTTEGILPQVDDLGEGKQVDTDKEQVGESEEQAKAEVTEGEDTEVSEKEDTEVSEEEEKPDPEEQFQERLKSEYATWQSKTLTPIVKERDELKRKLAEATDETDLKVLRLHDENEIGEEDAAKYDSTRKKVISRVREYEQKRDEVNANMEYLNSMREIEKSLGTDNLVAHIDWLAGIRKQNTSTMDIIKIYQPEISDKMDKAIKRLNSTSSPEHYKDVLNTIKSEYKGKKPKQIIESGGQGPGTGELSDEEFKDQYGKGLLKSTPENMKRAAKLAGYSLPVKRR